MCLSVWRMQYTIWRVAYCLVVWKGYAKNAALNCVGSGNNKGTSTNDRHVFIFTPLCHCKAQRCVPSHFFTPSTTYYNMRNRSMIWSNPIERRIHDATDKEVSTSSFLWLIHTTYLCTKCNTYKYFGTQTNILKYKIPGKAQDMDTLLVFCHIQTGAITIFSIS